MFSPPPVKGVYTQVDNQWVFVAISKNRTTLVKYTVLLLLIFWPFFLLLLTFWFKQLKGQSYMICEQVGYIVPAFDHTSDIFFIVLHLYVAII
jgi:hypothetical protein